MAWPTSIEEQACKKVWLPKYKVFSQPAPRGAEPPPEQFIKLVATPVGPRAPRMLQAYHTSVMVGGAELSFGMLGISIAYGPASHNNLPRSSETVVRDVGWVGYVDAVSFRKRLLPYFRRGTYDLLRKNCNCFSDVCLSVLVGVRLDNEYRYLEEAAISIDKTSGLVRRLSFGVYKPNPQADAFSVEGVVSEFGDVEHAI